MIAIDTEKVKKFIFECFGVVKDVPLFYRDGIAYFYKIKFESWPMNLYRLALYVLLYSLIQVCVRATKASTEFNLYQIFGNAIVQLPVIVLTFFVVLAFSDFHSKSNLSDKIASNFKTSLNYAVFQANMALIFPMLLFEGFVISENYLFYYLNAFVSTAWLLQLYLYFSYLFFKTKIKRVICVLMVFGISTLVNNTILSFGEGHFYRNGRTLLFEDPIASEFVAFDCTTEVSNIKNIVNVDMLQKLSILVAEESKFGQKYALKELSASDVFILYSNSRQGLKIYKDRLLEQNNQYKIIEDKIHSIEQKLRKANFRRTREYLNQIMEIYKDYTECVKAHDKVLKRLAGIHIDNPDIGKDLVAKQNQEAPSNEAARLFAEILDTQKRSRYLEEIVSLSESCNEMLQIQIKMHKKQIQLNRDVEAYFEHIMTIKKFFILYHFNPFPLKEYEIK